VPDDKLESLMSELRAIDRIGGLEARRIRRLEIVGEINVLLNKTGRDSDRTQRSYAPVSMNG
jgi:hypothetical protein